MSAKFSWDDIKLVQNLIERCLQQYMTQTEIVAALLAQANIEPGFTCLVWQKLQEQNPRFFYEYSIRLQLKDQIVAFNYLVDQQSQLQHKLQIAARAKSPAAGMAVDSSGTWALSSSLADMADFMGGEAEGKDS